MNEVNIVDREVIDSFNGKYCWLSNFYMEPCGTTNEHRYQAEKAKHHPELRTQILGANTPGLAKRLGRSVPCNMRWWQGVREKAMIRGLRVKFSHPEMRDLLLGTGNAVIIEGNYWHDNYWGDCKCRKCRGNPGMNRLGTMLMQIRDELAAEMKAVADYLNASAKDIEEFIDAQLEQAKLDEPWTEEEVNEILDDEERRHRGE